MKTIGLCIVLLALSVCLCDGWYTTQDELDFLDFTMLYQKHYISEFEHLQRYLLWKRNSELINRHNEEAELGLHSYTMAMNQFGDMTLEEFRAEMLGYKPRHQEIGSTTDLHMSDPLPESVDWKAKGYVTEVGNQFSETGLFIIKFNGGHLEGFGLMGPATDQTGYTIYQDQDMQGQCGSCWAFTATGALEGQHKRKTGTLVDLSEQNLMDCSGKQGNLGCTGGWMDASFTYVKVNGGIDTEASYPYNSTSPGTGTCKYTRANKGATCTGFVDLPKGNETALQVATATIGPLSVAVDASHEGFMYYKSGVYDDTTCQPRDVDHSLVVTGYGTEDGKPYWECKNSWGTSWGNNGYIRMVRNKDNQCGIATEASYPTV